MIMTCLWLILTAVQILSLTCNNASNNDMMVEELVYLVAAFDREASRTRCFAHIINLIAKSVIKQFDLPKGKAGAGEALNDAVEELIALAREIEDEEQVTLDSANEEDNIEDDNVEDWVDEWETMSEEEIQQLNNDVQPVRWVLVKVSRLTPSSESLITIDHVSSARLHMPSRTLQPLSYQGGMQLLKN
jgi:hypothetical protein